MTVEKFLDNFWRYYLILEERFENSTRYVELCPENYSTYSIDFVNQLQAIGSEVDVIMKSMSGFLPMDRKSISDYAPKILSSYPDIGKWEIIVRNISCKPFDGWDVSHPADSLSWWKAYNSIKHGRDGNFKEANLKNVLSSLMGLYLLEKLYFKNVSEAEGQPDALLKDSELFSIVGWKSKYIPFSNMIATVTEDGCLDINGGGP